MSLQRHSEQLAANTVCFPPDIGENIEGDRETHSPQYDQRGDDEVKRIIEFVRWCIEIEWKCREAGVTECGNGMKDGKEKALNSSFKQFSIYAGVHEECADAFKEYRHQDYPSHNIHHVAHAIAAHHTL